MAGRKAKVTTDKKDRKYQRDRTKQLQQHDATMAKLPLAPPPELVDVARDAYIKISKELNNQGLIKSVDSAIVVALCKQIQINRSAYEHLFVGIGGNDPEGIQTPIYKAVQGPDGKIQEHLFLGYKKNPAVQTLDSSTAKIKSLCETLGMTPSSRASLLDLTKPDSDDSQSIADVLKSTNSGF